MLSETQLLLLNNLIYKSEFTDKSYNNLTVGEIINDIINKQNSGEQQGLNADDWTAIYEMAQSDPAIKNLRVTHMNHEVETGAKMACFVDESGNAYAVFAGTGINEWRDDAVAGAEIHSVQQEKALDWFEALPYDNITVSGHSKGGNKAMYVTVLSDKAGDCYAFDGEGFSVEFCDEYADEIAEKKNKIHLRSNYKDYVNPLLITIAGDIKYIVNDEGVDGYQNYHSPKALFKYEDGKITYSIGDFGEQSTLMQFLHDFTVYLIENATQAEKIIALSVFGELLQKILTEKEGGIVREDILNMFGAEGLDIIARYLMAFLKDLIIENFGKYKTFIENAINDPILSVLFNTLLPQNFLQALFTFSAPVVSSLYKKLEQLAISQGRDFSQSTKERLLNAARETEEEQWWQVTRWDCWYRVEQHFGLLQLDRYAGRVDEYYRKLIDINDSSVKEIERIFSEVYRLDSDYGGRIEELTAKLNSEVLNKLKSVSASIVPNA